MHSYQEIAKGQLILRVRILGQRLPFRICINTASESLKIGRSVRSAPRLSEETEAEQKSNAIQILIKVNRIRATRLLKFLKRAPRKGAVTKMSDSGVLDSINSTQSRFCLAHQVEHCKKCDNIKIYCLKDRRRNCIQLTNNRMKRYDRTGKGHNFKPTSR